MGCLAGETPPPPPSVLAGGVAGAPEAAQAPRAAGTRLCAIATRVATHPTPSAIATWSTGGSAGRILTLSTLPTIPAVASTAWAMSARYPDQHTRRAPIAATTSGIPGSSTWRPL